MSAHFSGMSANLCLASTIGIGISLSEIRVVAAKGGGVVLWSAAAPRDREQDVTKVVEQLLSTRPLSVRRSARAACVIGSNEGQLRPLHGVPKLRSAADQCALIGENVDRFFVSGGAKLRVSTLHRSQNGEVWAAAVESEIVSSIAKACRSQGIRFVGVVPVAAALGRLLADAGRAADGDVAAREAELEWTDEGTRLRMRFIGADAIRVQRTRVDATEPRRLTGAATRLPPAIDPALADAFAATLVRARDPFVIAEYDDDHHRERGTRRRTALWIGLAAACLIAAALAPGALASRRASHDRTRLATLDQRRRQLRQVQSALAQATTEINTVSAFEASRRSATLLLAELAMALPDSTAIATFHSDSMGGNLTVLAPRAAGALEAVTAVPALTRVQLFGSITRETTGGLELERATMRFVFVERRRSTDASHAIPDGRTAGIASVGSANSSSQGGAK